MHLIAERTARELGKPVSELFSYQFALVPDESYGLSGFVTRPFGRRVLTHCPKLDVATLHDAEDQTIGYCLGVAVDGVGVRVASGRKLPVVRSDPQFWPNIENFAVQLAGRWLLIIDNGLEERILGDASGMYNCIYDPISGGVGSTLLMALMRDIEESTEVDYTRTLTHGLRLPFGRTRDKYARRLAVNHSLNLKDWSEVRFWPPRGAFSEIEHGKEPEVIASIRDRLAAVFAGIVTSAPTSVGMSGGNDSRNLVAAGKATLGHVSSFYSFTHNFNSRTDYLSARLVVNKLGFSVDRFPKSAMDFDDAEIEFRNRCFAASTGYSIGLHATANVSYEKRPDRGHLILTGNAMEALRAAHWKSEHTNRPNRFKFGLKRCLFTHSIDADFFAQWLPKYRQWLAELPDDAQSRYIDILFCEHNLPYLGTLYFSFQDNYWLCPFNDRRLIQLSSSLPVAYRFQNRANDDFLKLAAPELCDIPFERDIRKSRAQKAQLRSA